MIAAVRYAVEGRTDGPVVEKLLRSVNLTPARNNVIAGGKSKLDKRLPALNRSSSDLLWLVVRDLDSDDRTLCIPDLRAGLLKGRANRGMCFRFAVRAIESWLIADHQAFAPFFAVRRRLPERTDELDDPKLYLINLCRRATKKEIKEGIPPRPGSGRREGPEYTAIIREFARVHWSPARARQHSSSLDRATQRLVELKARLEQSDLE